MFCQIKEVWIIINEAGEVITDKKGKVIEFESDSEAIDYADSAYPAAKFYYSKVVTMK